MITHHRSLFFALPFFIVLACKSGMKEEEAVTTPVSGPALKQLWETDTLLKTAESVFFDEAYNLIYVACIGNTPPDAKDGDGFITRLDMAGKILDLMWVKGLDAPKGMAKVASTLYVADITRIVAIDTENGQILQSYPLENASFLNDITADPDGTLYISDSNTGAIYRFKDGQSSILVQNPQFGRPNGLYAEANRLIMAAAGSGNIYAIGKSGSDPVVLTEGIAGGDGVEKYQRGYLISSWNGEVYSLNMNWEKTMILDTKEAKKNAADIDVIESKNLLLVPTFFGNSVVAYEIGG